MFVYGRFNSDSIKRTIKIQVGCSESAGSDGGGGLEPNQQENTIFLRGTRTVN
jgi:hypothetical protein